MTLISRSAYRLSRRAGQQAKQAQRVAGLSTAAKVAQQVPAMLRADNRVSRTLPKAKEGECTDRPHRTETRRGETRDRRASKVWGNDGNLRRWRGYGSGSRSKARWISRRSGGKTNSTSRDLVVSSLLFLSSPWSYPIAISTSTSLRLHLTRLASFFLSPLPFERPS
jgi:hypothetical protein